MGFMTSGVFWGCILILWGASMIVETVFHIHIPLFRIVVALIVIFLGVRLLTGRSFPSRSEHAIVFGEQTFGGPVVRSEYNVVFGQGTLDFGRSLTGKLPDMVTVNAVFGAANVRLDPKRPVRVKASTAFGHVRLPDRSTAAFGEAEWEAKGVREGTPLLRVNAVFGSVDVSAD